MQSNALLVRGLFGGDWCSLALAGGRLSLVRAGAAVFDVPLDAVEGAERLGWLPLRRGQLRLRVAGTVYTLAFPAMKGFAGRTTGGQQADRWLEQLNRSRPTE